VETSLTYCLSGLLARTADLDPPATHLGTGFLTATNFHPTVLHFLLLGDAQGDAAVLGAACLGGVVGYGMIFPVPFGV
jgi:hypothetical protein